VVAVALGALKRPTRKDLGVYSVGMVLLIVVGLLGTWLHIRENLVAKGTIIGERFLRGAPFLAPMLFADMGALGLITLMDPVEP
jgi:hypothetical protein